MYEHRPKAEIKFIAVDWGGSNFRAYAIDINGEVRQRTKAHQGVLRIKDENYSGTIKRLLGKWFNKYPGVPIVMSGMVGSSHGWQEIEHVEAPVSMYELANYIEKVFNHRFDRDIYIVPGVKAYRKNGVSFDEMRGKEVQVFGALQEIENKDKKQLICLPGSHSKWVEVNDGVITDIHTFVTGELISLLSRTTLISTFIQCSNYDAEGFAKGLEVAKDSKSILSDLYTVYTEGASENVPHMQLSSYLSALIIASEVKAAKEIFPDNQAITVVGAPWLIEMYQQTCDLFGFTMQGIKSDVATVIGLNDLYDSMKESQEEQPAYQANSY